MAKSKDRSLLALADGALLLTMLLAGLVALLTLLAAVASKEITDVAFELPKGGISPLLPAGVTLDHAQAMLSAHVGLGYRLASWAVGPASTLLVLAGASVLHGIVGSARLGDPFVSANVRRIRVLGFVALAFFLLSAARSLVDFLIHDHLGLPNFTSTVSFVPIVLVAVLFGLAAIWQRGVDLRDEQRPIA